MTKLITKIITLNNRKTSMRLAQAEWEAVDLICKRENIYRKALLEMIAEAKDPSISLTSTVRLFAIVYFYQLQKLKDTPSYSSFKQQGEEPIFSAIKSIV
jgi:predicted DNA-binding ribbon-helix-helix protein